MTGDLVGFLLRMEIGEFLLYLQAELSDYQQEWKP